MALVSLRTHSHYTWLEGTASPQALLARAAELGYQSLALTDTNTLTGAVEFVEAARVSGVRPILGADVRVGTQRATVLVGEQSGYRSLCAILTRINFQKITLADVLAAHPDGLHVLVEDTRLLGPPLTDSYKVGRLWVELVRPGRSEQAEQALLEAAAKLCAKPVASSGVYLGTQGQYGLYRLLHAVRKGQSLDQLPAQLPVVPDHHLPSEEELQARFTDMPNALSNASILAGNCCSDVLPRGLVMPPARVPSGEDAQEHLHKLCKKAFGQRRGQWYDEQAAAHRLEEELALVCERDLAAYILVVADIAQECKNRNYPVALVGSAGSFFLFHLLGLTPTDPVQYGLPGVRFLHPLRDGLPDIDLRMPNQKRGAILKWVEERYGKDNVARVGSVIHFRKSAFSAVAKAHGLLPAQIETLEEELGEKGIEQLKEITPKQPPASWPLDVPAWEGVLAATRALMDRPQKMGRHDSGFVITKEPVPKHAPVEKDNNGFKVCQFNKDSIERIGLVKLDVLPCGTLTALSTAWDQLKTLAPEAVGTQPEDGDRAIQNLLAAGDVLGVSNLETQGMRYVLLRMKPGNLLHVAMGLAAHRPGVGPIWCDTFLRRWTGEEPTRFPHPSLSTILADSRGVLLTEDDADRAIAALGGKSAAEADQMRRRLADEKTREGAAKDFLNACHQNHIPKLSAEELLGQLQNQELYTYCKAHALSTSATAWEELWIRAHYPLAFWFAVLVHRKGNCDLWVYVEEAKRSGVEVLLPCVNRSQGGWTQEVGRLRVGLNSIRTLSAVGTEQLLEKRKGGGVPFASLADLRRRVQLSQSDLIALARVGALDTFGWGRAALVRQIEGLSEESQPSQRRRRSVPGAPWPLAGLLDEHPFSAHWRDEWELLGFQVGPPLMALLRPQLPRAFADSRDLESGVVKVAGLVANVSKGRQFVTLQDEWGLIDVTVPAGLRDNLDLEAMGLLVLVEGAVEEKQGCRRIVAATVERMLPEGPARLRIYSGPPPPTNNQNGNGASEKKPAPANGTATTKTKK